MSTTVIYNYFIKILNINYYLKPLILLHTITLKCSNKLLYNVADFNKLACVKINHNRVYFSMSTYFFNVVVR